VALGAKQELKKCQQKRKKRQQERRRNKCCLSQTKTPLGFRP